MFRRKDEEFNTDVPDGNAQGSLLANSVDTVNVLSPQQAAQYNTLQHSAANQPQVSAAPSTSATSASSHFGQVARPIPQPEGARSASTLSTPSPFRPTSSTSQPVNDTARRAAEPRAASAPSTAKEGRRILTVGGEILLKGEITTCDRLVIEGKVDATVKDVHTLELLESGSFKGYAEVDYAEISGKFEGDLIVKSALVIYGSGSVSGKITYGEIEIQRGGQLIGEIQTIDMKSAGNRSKNKEAA